MQLTYLRRNGHTSGKCAIDDFKNLQFWSLLHTNLLWNGIINSNVEIIWIHGNCECNSRLKWFWQLGNRFQKVCNVIQSGKVKIGRSQPSRRRRTAGTKWSPSGRCSTRRQRSFVWSMGLGVGWLLKPGKIRSRLYWSRFFKIYRINTLFRCSKINILRLLVCSSSHCLVKFYQSSVSVLLTFRWHSPKSDTNNCIWISW